MWTQRTRRPFCNLAGEMTRKLRGGVAASSPICQVTQPPQPPGPAWGQRRLGEANAVG